jgi:hypothetical protein
MNIGSKNRLTPLSARLFTGATLFDELARTVCAAGVLPRKELYESWQVTQRVERWFGHNFRAGASRLVELCSGHGLASLILLLRHPTLNAVSVERTPPASATKLRAVLFARWPNLAPRLTVSEGDLSAAPLAEGDLALAVHACGSLTDAIIARAIAARASVALLPCCQDIAPAHFLRGWLEGPLAIDTLRAARLHQAGYAVTTQLIDREVTPQNRLLLALRRAPPTPPNAQ